MQGGASQGETIRHGLVRLGKGPARRGTARYGTVGFGQVRRGKEKLIHLAAPLMVNTVSSYARLAAPQGLERERPANDGN